MNIDFQQLEQEKAKIEHFLAQPEAYAAADFAEKSRRLAEINVILELKRAQEQAAKNLAEAQALVDDPDLGELARADVEKWAAEQERLAQELKRNCYHTIRRMINRRLWKSGRGQEAMKLPCLRASFTGCMCVMRNGTG